MASLVYPYIKELFKENVEPLLHPQVIPMMTSNLAFICICLFASTYMLMDRFFPDALTGPHHNNVKHLLKEREQLELDYPKIYGEKGKASTPPANQHLKNFADMDVKTIREGILGGLFTPLEVSEASTYLCIKYGSYRSKINAITQELYHVAQPEAKKLNANTSGILAGVPISIKDCLGVKNTHQTGGLACRTDPKFKSEFDSVLADTLRNECKAVITCRGNVSQCMMLPESRNQIWGETFNPWDLGRTPGGSSGGEGALVAMGCVPLAIGSDVGGSVRIPAAFCGVSGFKPTTGRISKAGCMAPKVGERHGLAMVIPSTPGPIGKTVNDCKLFCQGIWCDQHFKQDLSLPPFLWSEARYNKTLTKRKLKIGYFLSDGWFEPCKTAKRLTLESVALLREAGHEVVEFPFPGDGWKTYQLYIALAASEGNMRGFIDALDGETLLSEYDAVRAASNLPNFLRPLVASIVDARRGSLVKSTVNGGLSAFDMQSRMADAIEMRSLWTKKFQEYDIDAVIHPALPLPALKCRSSKDLTGAFSYTLLANLILFPAGCIPVTTIREDETDYTLSSLPENQRDFWANKAKECMQGSAGLPMSLSVMTAPYRDEECLAIMSVIEGLVKFKGKPKAHL